MVVEPETTSGPGYDLVVEPQRMSEIGRGEMLQNLNDENSGFQPFSNRY
jgi:hypothetical protein